jgi:hypothetical protein
VPDQRTDTTQQTIRRIVEEIYQMDMLLKVCRKALRFSGLHFLSI